MGNKEELITKFETDLVSDLMAENAMPDALGFYGDYKVFITECRTLENGDSPMRVGEYQSRDDGTVESIRFTVCRLHKDVDGHVTDFIIDQVLTNRSINTFTKPVAYDMVLRKIINSVSKKLIN